MNFSLRLKSTKCHLTTSVTNYRNCNSEHSTDTKWGVAVRYSRPNSTVEIMILLPAYKRVTSSGAEAFEHVTLSWKWKESFSHWNENTLARPLFRLCGVCSMEIYTTTESQWKCLKWWINGRFNENENTMMRLFRVEKVRRHQGVLRDKHKRSNARDLSNRQFWARDNQSFSNNLEKHRFWIAPFEQSSNGKLQMNFQAKFCKTAQVPDYNYDLQFHNTQQDAHSPCLLN